MKPKDLFLQLAHLESLLNDFSCLRLVNKLGVLVFEGSLLNQRLIEYYLKLWDCNVIKSFDFNELLLKLLENSKRI